MTVTQSRIQIEKAGGKVLRPVFPNAGIAAEYRRKLDLLIAEMHRSYVYWIKACYRANEPAMAMDAGGEFQIKETPGHTESRKAMGFKRVIYVDAKAFQAAFQKDQKEPLIWNSWRFENVEKVLASGQVIDDFPKVGISGGFVGVTDGRHRIAVAASRGEMIPVAVASKAQEDALRKRLGPGGVETPADALQRALKGMGDRWQKNFDEAAPKLAEYFAKSSTLRSDRALQKILRDAGFSVKFKMTVEMQDVLQASIAENVSLIKSISQQYHTEVQGIVMRSVQRGRDLKTMSDELQDRYQVTRKRAALISLDQNNKSTSAMLAARQTSLGIEEAVWLHSGAGKYPRPTHVKNSGKRYKISEGWWDPAVERFIWPGTEVRCRCVSKPVVKGFS